MMKFSTVLFGAILAIAPLSIPLQANADTTNASCIVYPKGDDRASWSGTCTFSQRQGNVGIQLQNGKRYELSPTGQPNKFRDQNGRPAHREAGAGDQQIYRLSRESIYVNFDGGASGQGSGNTGGSSASARQPAAGTPVKPLSDLVGARAGQAENVIEQRGYRFVKSNASGDSVYSQWLEGRTNYCVTIRTEQGRYQSIVYAGNAFDCQK